MADLASLVRVRHHAVEQRQKALAELYRQADALADKKKSLLQSLQTEREALTDDAPVEIVRAYSLFADSVKNKCAALDEGMRALDIRIEGAREAMREAFAEFKKIEITHDRRVAEALAALEKKQNALLEETALQTFRRLKDTAA